MKRSKAEEDLGELGRAEAVESENVSPETKPDALADYREALADLAAAQEKLATLRQVESEVVAQAAKLEADREAALNLAAEADLEKALEGDVEAQVDIAGLTETSTKLEICRRKLSDLSGRSQAAEAELSSVTGAVAARFSSLWHAFFQYCLERAKEVLSEQLVPGVAPHIIELVVRHFKSVQPVRALDIRTDDTPGLLVQATRLLEAVSATPGFIAPPYVAPTPTAPELDPLWTPGVPWGDRGVDVDSELRKMHQEDSTLNLPRAMRLLYERHPEIFTAPKEGNLSLNEPQKWQAPMIGSTSVPKEPAEERFSHA